jgi:endonuclease G
MKTRLKILSIVLSFFIIIPVAADQAGAQPDNTEIAEASRNLEYLVPIFAYKGRPLNEDPNRKVTVLINHGYMVGYSVDRKQPLWAAYRVSQATKYVDYKRPPFFYSDLRLPESARVEPDTFPGYDRGHMVPNYAINTQYGQLSQLETFLMSNICPQHAKLNQGIWKELEARIIDKYAPAREHIWVLSGPIFGSNPGKVKGVDIPSHFFMILVDVGDYPAYRPYILAFKFPQRPASGAQLNSDFLFSVDQIEEQTGLDFFPEFTQNEEQRYERQPASAVWPAD